MRFRSCWHKQECAPRLEDRLRAQWQYLDGIGDYYQDAGRTLTYSKAPLCRYLVMNQELK